MLKNLRQGDFKGKKILVRVDYNVELDDIKNIQEHFRFHVVKETLAFLSEQEGAKIALLTHFGRPEAGVFDESYSTKRLLPSVTNATGKKIVFVPDCTGEVVTQALAHQNTDEILLLENVRFKKGEEEGDIELAKDLARPFDIFINEAFSVCHRHHASVAVVPKFLPSFAGYRLLEEIDQLDKTKLSPEHPAVAIIGGAKIETKLPLIQALEPNYDCILVGGKIANEALDQKITFSEKVLLPIDFNAPERLDIGAQTIAYFSKIIQTAKTIVWNGPMGKFEEKPYNIGTDAILNAILETNASVVIGGGESLAVVEAAGVMNKIGFVSSGGGAMLEYMSGKALPGIVALENARVQ
jgi:phosphoglycerate kinase